MTYHYLCRNVTTFICNILCLVWIVGHLVVVWYFDSFGEYNSNVIVYVYLLALADTCTSVVLISMVSYYRCLITHTEGCVQIQLSQPPVLYPPYDVTYQENLAPTAPEDNLAPTAPQDDLAPTAPPEEKL